MHFNEFQYMFTVKAVLSNHNFYDADQLSSSDPALSPPHVVGELSCPEEHFHITSIKLWWRANNMKYLYF